MSNLCFVDSDFTVASAIGKPRTTALFDGDAGRNFMEQDYEQFFDSFAPQPLNSVHPNIMFAGFYLVGETPLQDMGGGVAKWTRQYVSIPTPRSDYESFSWRRPGLYPGGINAAYTITGFINGPHTSPTVADGTTRITTATNHGFILGDLVILVYRNNVGNAFEGQFVAVRAVTAIVDTTHFEIDVLFFQSSNYKFLYCQKSSLGRDPSNRVVTSRIDRAYFLPGVSLGIATPDDIAISNPTVITTQFNVETEVYNTTTIPTQQTYVNLVNANSWIVAEASILRRLKGNIFERSTRYVRAQ